MNLSFIVIDESELDCFIARKILQSVDKDFKIETFQNPLLAFEKVKAGITPPDLTLINIILLDLQMPVMNGFEFVEAFEKLDRKIQRNYYIHILSSTRNKNDINRLLSFNSVNSVIEKPLTAAKLKVVIERVLND